MQLIKNKIDEEVKMRLAGNISERGSQESRNNIEFLS